MLSYRLLTYILSPFIFLHLIWKSIKEQQLRYFLQRLGFSLSSKHQPIFRNTIWFHCASVGEVNTALPLIIELHNQDSKLRFTITSNTTTGASVVLKKHLSFVQHIYLPIDWSSSIRRFINTIEPVSLFIIETELWPNLISECNRSKISVNIITARLSSKTTQTNQWIASIYRKILLKINHIYTRSETDRDDFINLGASEHTTTTVGSLKYANSKSKTHKQELTKRTYVLVASTHDDEELQITKQWLTLNRDELLVIAPRHPERKDKIISQLQLHTHQIVARTDNEAITEKTDIFILDTVGELVSWMVDAEVVVMGGSFINHGGHNVIEPAQLGKAIVYGPHMENFEFESQLLLDNKAAIQVDSTTELARMLPIILDNETTQSQLETDALIAVKPFESILSDYTDIVLKQIQT